MDLDSLAKRQLGARIGASILLALCLGCDDVVSTSTLVLPGQRVRDDRLVGSWAEADSGDPFQLQVLSDGRYRSSGKGADAELFFSIARIGSTLILQWEQEDCSLHLFFGDADDQRCYSFAKLEIDDRSFSLAELDVDRAFRDSVAGRLGIAHEVRRKVPSNQSPPQTCIVLTASTDELRSFLEAYLEAEGVFKKTKRVFLRANG